MCLIKATQEEIESNSRKAIFKDNCQEFSKIDERCEFSDLKIHSLY